MQMDAKSDGFLDVGGQHSLYYCVEGAPLGRPVVILHGGPGGRMSTKWGEIFDTELFRLIYFDQRGCGRSTPFGDTAANTLDDLVSDMEKLRAHLQIDQWLLYGGSWGTTLALAYGVKHADRCLGFLLRGVFLARHEDMAFFLWTTRHIYPEAHRELCKTVAAANGGREPDSYDGLIELVGYALKNPDQEQAAAVAQAWAKYEITISAVEPIPTSDDPAADTLLLSAGLLEHHYFANVLPPNPPLLESISRTPELTKLPCWIVHGRLDLVCPVVQAVELQAIWPGCKAFLNDGAGHWTFERANREKLYECAAMIETAFAPRK